MYIKVKREIGRSVSRRNKSFKRKLKDALWSGKNSVRKIDYAQKREYLSPRLRNKRMPTKIKIEIFLLVIFTFTFFVTVAFHPFFLIKELKTSGLNRIDKTEFTESVFDILDCKKLYMFSCKEYIFTNVNEIRDVLFDKYSLNSISIKKIFPNLLEIDLEEKISTIIYDDSATYSFVDLSGQYVEVIANVSEDEWYAGDQVVSSTDIIGVTRKHKPNAKRIYNEVGNYPLLYDSRDDKSESPVALKSEYINSIIDWYNYFNKNLFEEVNYIELLNTIGDASIYTYSGWHVIVRLGERFESQKEQLKYILDNEINNQPFTYIELRYPDRVYWQ
ncbi:MAG: hypothetical protein Q8P20_10705 [bacterium]|nr:hypothetical protein [bacterium]